MKRAIVLGVLLMVGALSLATRAQQRAGGAPQADAPKVVEVEKLRDNLFMLKGGGGNTAIFVGSTGVVVVDTKNPGWGQPILDKIKELTPKPVTTIINTHTHGDHVSGNVEFPATVEVVVQENTKANMQEMRGATGIAQQGFRGVPAALSRQRDAGGDRDEDRVVIDLDRCTQLLGDLGADVIKIEKLHHAAPVPQ